jgi:hypothetical protein
MENGESMNKIEFSLLCALLAAALILSCAEVEPSESASELFDVPSPSKGDTFVYCVDVLINKVCYKGAFTDREDCLVSNSCPYKDTISVLQSSSSVFPVSSSSAGVTPLPISSSSGTVLPVSSSSAAVSSSSSSVLLVSSSSANASGFYCQYGNSCVVYDSNMCDVLGGVKVESCN